MTNDRENLISVVRLRVLAEFRHQLRRFLQFSEEAAGRYGLQPQQHQLLLQVAGAPEGVLPTVSYAAVRLGLKHHSVVELSKRCEETGLMTRKQSDADRRSVILGITPAGRKILDGLSSDHARELNELAPQLLKTFSSLKSSTSKTKRKRAGELREG
jgi:DNA-binding MarR family transcriptional regulator